MHELDLHCALLCETWFKTNAYVQNELAEIDCAEDISIICKNRSGKRGGGVAIAFNKNKMVLNKFPLNNATKFEILCAAGCSTDDTRKFAIFVAYFPPSLKASQAKQLWTV